MPMLPEQIVLKKERFGYQFYGLDSKTIASFRKRSSKDQTNYKVVQQRKVTNAYARIFKIYYTNDFGFLPLLA